MTAFVEPSPIKTMLGLLDSDWTKANTDDSTPTVRGRAQPRRIGALKTSKNLGDELLIYEINRGEPEFGIDAKFFERRHVISVDVRSQAKDTKGKPWEDHVDRVVSEISRIIAVNKIEPTTLPSGAVGYDRIKWGELRDFSNAGAGHYRFVRTVRFITYLEAYPT